MVRREIPYYKVNIIFFKFKFFFYQSPKSDEKLYFLMQNFMLIVSIDVGQNLITEFYSKQTKHQSDMGTN